MAKAKSGRDSIKLSRQQPHPDDPKEAKQQEELMTDAEMAAKKAESEPDEINLEHAPTAPPVSKGIPTAAQVEAAGKKPERPMTVNEAYRATKPTPEQTAILERHFRRYVKRSGGLRKNISTEAVARAAALKTKLGRKDYTWDESIAIVGFGGVREEKPKRRGLGQRK